MRDRNLYIIALLNLQVGLHASHERIVAQKHLSIQMLPRRTGIDALRNKLRITLLRKAALLGKLSQQTIDGQPRRRWHQPHAGSITTPCPISRAGDDPGADGIEHHVPRQLEQVGLAIDQNRLKAPLKQMSHALMSPVAGLGKHPVELTHAFG